MKTLNYFIIHCLLFITLIINPLQGNETNWQPWSKQVFAKAEQEHRLVFISLTAQWCQFCKKMDKTTFKDPSVIDELNQNFVAVKADEAEYPQLAKQFANVGRPGTIILDSQGKTLLAKTGYLKPQWMLWMLQGTIAEHSPEQVLGSTNE